MIHIPSWDLLRSSWVLRMDIGYKMDTGRSENLPSPSFHVHQNCQLAPKHYSNVGQQQQGGSWGKTKFSRRILVTGSRSRRKLVVKVQSSLPPAGRLLKKLGLQLPSPSEGASRLGRPTFERTTSSPALRPFPPSFFRILFSH